MKITVEIPPEAEKALERLKKPDCSTDECAAEQVLEFLKSLPSKCRADDLQAAREKLYLLSEEELEAIKNK